MGSVGGSKIFFETFRFFFLFSPVHGARGLVPLVLPLLLGVVGALLGGVVGCDTLLEDGQHVSGLLIVHLVDGQLSGGFQGPLPLEVVLYELDQAVDGAGQFVDFPA